VNSNCHISADCCLRKSTTRRDPVWNNRSTAPNLNGHIRVLSVEQYLCRTPYRQDHLPTIGNQVTSASQSLNPWKRDVMPDRSPAYHGRGGTVGGNENCAVDTKVSNVAKIFQHQGHATSYRLGYPFFHTYCILVPLPSRGNAFGRCLIQA